MLINCVQLISKTFILLNKLVSCYLNGVYLNENAIYFYSLKSKHNVIYSFIYIYFKFVYLYYYIEPNFVVV